MARIKHSTWLVLAFALGCLSLSVRGDTHKLPYGYRSSVVGELRAPTPKLCGGEFQRLAGAGPRLRHFRVAPYVVESFVVYFDRPDAMPAIGEWAIRDAHGNTKVVHVQSRYDPGNWIVIHVPHGDPAVLRGVAELKPVQSIRPNCSTRAAIAVDDEEFAISYDRSLIARRLRLLGGASILAPSCPLNAALNVIPRGSEEAVHSSDDLFLSDANAFTALASIRADIAWRLGARGSGITIAILDTAVDCHHEDLVSQFVDLRPYLRSRSTLKASTSPECAMIDCVVGDCAIKAVAVDGSSAHGTEMAGIAAALADNGHGAAGVAPEAKILPVRIAGQLEELTTEERLAQAVLESVRYGATIISMSWSIASGDADGVLGQAIAKAGAHGALVVSAAGDGWYVGLFRPASFDIDNLLPVAGVDESDKWSSGSNCDPARVAIAAPVQYLAATTPGHKYRVGNLATSGATALVAGAAAAVWSHPNYKHLSPVELKQALIDNARACPALEPWIKLGRVLDLSFLDKDFRATTQRWACGVQ